MMLVVVILVLVLVLVLVHSSVAFSSFSRSPLPALYVSTFLCSTDIFKLNINEFDYLNSIYSIINF